MYPDSELTHRVEVFTGHALSPLPLAWDDSANWRGGPPANRRNSSSWRARIRSTILSGKACVSCSASTAGVVRRP